MFDVETESPPGSAELPLERLEHEIVQLAAHINAGTCRWLELVAEFDRREGWGSWGCRSCAEWVAWRCALDPRSAREHVRVARRLEELPLIAAAFARGELSYSKVRALSRVAREGSEAELLELAEQATAAQLDRIVRGIRFASTEDANEAHENRHLSTWWEADGSLSFSGNLPAEDGAALLAAIDAMHDLIRRRSEQPVDPPETSDTACARGDNGSAEPASEAHTSGSAEPAAAFACGSAEPRERRAATNADALVSMAQAAVAGGDGSSDPSGGDRREIVVHVDASTFSGRIADGSALAAETIRRLACDSGIVPIVEDADGRPLSVGRRTRSVPPSIARALRARDGTCGFPGCENRRFLDAHHIRHWAHGGETSVENLVLLCRRHHRAVHEGGYSLRRLADGSVRVKDARGTTVANAPKPPRGTAERVRRWPAGGDRGGDGGVAKAPRPGTGQRLDLPLTLSALLPRLAAARGRA